MKKPTIAILGATSHIAKGLIHNFLREGKVELHLYTRSPDTVGKFLGSMGTAAITDCHLHEGYEDLVRTPCDAVINCVGVGTMNRLRGNFSQYFTVTEQYDNLAIAYVRDHFPAARYVSFSSGAVYGRKCLVPAEEHTANCIQPNHITKDDYYAIVRLNAETKHRSMPHLNIVDLRLFSYFSRFIDLTDGYFITDLLNAILQKKVLATDAVNIVRDYVHPDDLFSMIQKCLQTGKVNAAFDVTSAKPVEKREILEYFSSHYGLRYEMKPSLKNNSPTGVKKVYYSTYKNAAGIGYQPKFSSLDTIKEEAKYILRP